jgi:hypothetical protein
VAPCTSEHLLDNAPVGGPWRPCGGFAPPRAKGRRAVAPCSSPASAVQTARVCLEDTDAFGSGCFRDDRRSGCPGRRCPVHSVPNAAAHHRGCPRVATNTARTWVSGFDPARFRTIDYHVLAPVSRRYPKGTVTCQPGRHEAFPDWGRDRPY